MTGKRQISTQAITLLTNPKSNHRPISGTNARTGTTWIPTAYGYRTRSARVLRCMTIAIAHPEEGGDRQPDERNEGGEEGGVEHVGQIRSPLPRSGDPRPLRSPPDAGVGAGNGAARSAARSWRRTTGR